MLEIPYLCSEEDELSGTDESIVDYSAYTEEDRLLIVMLASNGEVHSYLKCNQNSSTKFVVNIMEHCQLSSPPVTVCIGNQATFVLFGTSDGNLLVVPIKVILPSSSWRGTSWSSTSVVQLTSPAVEACLSVPTCIRCFVSNYPPRTYAVVTNKAGFIMVVDLMIRKCVIELRAPETIHKMDVFIDENSIELLITSFTGSQWIIPLEQNGKGIREVLTFCHPSDLQQLEPITSEYMGIDSNTILALDSEQSTVDMFPSMKSLAHMAKTTFKVPPETWLVHSVDNLLFTVSKESELRCALHFGLTNARLEYKLIRGMPEWRPLGIVSTPQLPGKLQTVYVVTERSLMKLEQTPLYDLQSLAAEFIFNLRRLGRSKALIAKVAEACHVDSLVFEKSLIPSLLASRKDKWLDSSSLGDFVELAKTVNLEMTELVEEFEKVGMEEQLLTEIVKASKTTEQLREKLVDLFVKKAKRVKSKEDASPAAIVDCDAELSHLLTTFEEISTGDMACLSCGLYKSAGLLAARRRMKREENSAMLKLIATEGRRMWEEAEATQRSNLLSLTCSLDWSTLTEQEAGRVCFLLSTWQRDVMSVPIHECCLRTSKVWMSKFPKSCKVLYLVSSAYIISDRSQCETSVSACPNSLDAGYNCSVAIDEKEQIQVWGDFTNQPERMREVTARPKKAQESNGGNSVTSSTSQENFRLPKVMAFSGGRPRAVSCGTEHVLLLSASGKLFAWGGNRYGQCGVGHTSKLSEFQIVEGPWPPVVKVSAGQFHSAIICNDGSLWTFGWNTYGQLGQGGRNITDRHTPTKVNGLISEVTDVACGRVHTVVLTSTGRVLVAGGGSYGQMGVDEDIRKTYSFTPLMLGTLKVRAISSNFFHSACVTDDDRIFEWGRPPHEQKLKMFVMRKLKMAQLKTRKEMNPEDMPPGKVLGEEDTKLVKQDLGLPAKIPREDFGLREVKHMLDGKITEISCGMSHSALLTENGTLYTWGKGLEHQLGNGHKTTRSEPHQVFEPNVRWARVRCGNNHTVACTQDGHVYAWGANGFSQCGFQPEKSPESAQRKLIYQSKDGARKAAIPLPDELSFVAKPAKIPGINIQAATSADEEEFEAERNATLNEKELLEIVKGSDSATIQRVADHLNSEAAPLSVMTAFINLMAGKISEAIAMVEKLDSDPLVNKSSVQLLSLLIWDVVANHEDVQTREVLTAAFKKVPMPEFLRRGKQVQQLWPTVWDDVGTQSSLSIDEKIAMLDGFASPARPIQSVTIPSAHLEMSSRIRVFAHCSHAEPAVVGNPPECSACLDEWTEKVRATLGAP